MAGNYHFRRAVCHGTALLLLSLAACHDKEKEKAAAPNPCLNQTLPVLSFNFLENTGTLTPDTAVVGNVLFDGPGAPYTAWEWKVGSDPRTFTQRRLTLSFSTGDSYQTYAVRLIARRPAAGACFPKDNGIDTLTRHLTLMPYAAPGSPLLGRFKGANLDAPADTFTVRISPEPDHHYPNNPAAPVLVYMTNLGKGCKSPWFQVIAGYRGAEFDYGKSDYGCFTETGTVQVADDRRSIRIEYSQIRVFPNRSSRVFVGQRVR